MPIVKCRLGEIMKENSWSIKDVTEKTNISRNTITSLAANATNRIDYATLERLCTGLNLTISDILIYVNEE